jgi:hypothetical protein
MSNKKPNKRPELFQAIHFGHTKNGAPLESFELFLTFLNTDSTRPTLGDYSMGRGYRIPDYILASWMAYDNALFDLLVPTKDRKAFWKTLEIAKANLQAKMQRNPVNKKLVDLVFSMDVKQSPLGTDEEDDQDEEHEDDEQGG